MYLPFFIDHAYLPAISILGPLFAQVEAATVLIAIARQESALAHRSQINGPARSYYQFEAQGGCLEVLTNEQTRPTIRRTLTTLDYPADISAADAQIAITHNDILATAFARLLLYTIPDPLPRANDPKTAWHQYLNAWRPGKPHPETWDLNYSAACIQVTAPAIHKPPTLLWPKYPAN